MKRKYHLNICNESQRVPLRNSYKLLPQFYRDLFSISTIDCKKDGRHVSASFHYRKVKRLRLSMAAAILSKLRNLEPESVQ